MILLLSVLLTFFYVQKVYAQCPSCYSLKCTQTTCYVWGGTGHQCASPWTHCYNPCGDSCCGSRLVYPSYKCAKLECVFTGCPCDNSCNGSCTFPSCPDGYSTTNPNNLCSSDTQPISCTYKNDCGNTCTSRSTCYKIEDNVAQSIPESLNMIIDEESYTLSINSNSPTIVKYPSIENNVKLFLPSRTKPDSSRELGYIFRANNYGVNDEWIQWNSCIDPYQEDFCSESTDNIQNFSPSEQSILETLKQGSEGKIGGLYYTVNRCDDNKLYSPVLETYYRVNNNPDIIDPENSDPSIIDDETVCGDDQECLKKKFLPNLGGEDSTSFKGCYTEDYTGLEVNNPLKVRVMGADKNSVNEIKGVIVWFSKSNDTPTLPKITSTYTATSVDEIGIMILQRNNSWNNEPEIYGINEDGNTWGLITDDVLKNYRNDPIARITYTKIEELIDTISFEFDLEFVANFSSNIGGLYNFKSVVLDTHMILEDGRVDQSHMKKYFDWGIDLSVPNIIDLSQDPQGPRELFLNWNINGTESLVTDVVINAYRDGDFLLNKSISLEGRNNEIVLEEGIPDSKEIGHIVDPNSWRFNNIGLSTYVSIGENRINIGDNEGGIISIYATAYDQGCNDATRAHNVDLRPWIATKGGVVYSKGRLGASSKDVSNVGQLEGVFKNILKEELDTGTELVSSRGDFITNLIHPEVSRAVRAINIYDSNDKKNYWFEYLKRKLNVQQLERDMYINESFEVLLSSSSSTYCGENRYCLFYATDQIEVEQGFVCDRDTLIMSEKDIILHPNIIESTADKTVGCIFVAKENIFIKEGGRQSFGDLVGYDYIEGFMIAENQILIEVADENDAVRDGLEIKGGLVSLGNSSQLDSAIFIKRNLRLYNYSHPTLVVSWDIKYARISETFFGSEAPMYKQEVGFKVF